MATIQTGETERLAAFVHGTTFAALPAGVVHATKRVVLDTIGCCVAGLTTESGQRVVRLKVDQGGKAEASLIANGLKLPCPSVSYVHSHLVNAMDADETFFNSGHFANCIVMPALAAAEAVGASGKEVIAAVAVGFDIAARVGRSMPRQRILPDNRVEALSPGGMSWAVFGTIAAVSRVQSITADQLMHAWGMGYQNSPLSKTTAFHTGPGRFMAKYAPYGAIAEAGVNSVRLAADGFTGDWRVLDRDHQFWKGYGASACDYDFMLGGLGQRWSIAETSFKPYPSGRLINLPIDLFKEIVTRESLSLREIEGVTVKIPPIALSQKLCEQTEVQTETDTSFSLPHALSLIAARIPPGPLWHAKEQLRNPELKALARKVRCEVVPGWHSMIVEQIKTQGCYLRNPAEVQVKARGRQFTAYGEYAKGDPWTKESTITDEELEGKFLEFSHRILGSDRAQGAINHVWSLDKAPSLQGLLTSLA